MFIKLTVRTIQPHSQPPQNWGNILHSPKQPWPPQRSWLISVEHAGFSKAVDSRTGSATKRKKTEQISASLMRNSQTDAPSNATRLYKLCIYELFFFFLYFWIVDAAETGFDAARPRISVLYEKRCQRWGFALSLHEFRFNFHILK